VLERSGAPLSGGQKQRIALARAFFGKPALVVLDEPNSNLDAAGEQALTETLKRAKQAGVTTVVITQRPALLSIVDRLLILRAGRAEAFGPPSEVLHRLVRGADAAKAPAPVAQAAPTPTSTPSPAPAPATQPTLVQSAESAAAELETGRSGQMR
jgi:ATP-binding cassette subfamily C protein